MFSNEGMTKEVIISTLIQLNIYYDGSHMNNGWMKIRCPAITHQDSDPSAGIHVNTGIISCFGCGLKTNLHKIVQQRLNCSYKEAGEYIFNGRPMPAFSVGNSIPNKKEPDEIRKVPMDEFVTVDFNPENFYYTKVRGFTQEYCEKFGIKLCYSPQYEDYFLTPIMDSKVGVDTFEARKLMLHERLISYYDFSSDVSPEEIFKRIKIRNGYKYKKGVVIDKDGIRHHDDNLIYFMKPKVLYPSETAVSHTLFNIENLDRNQNLYITEGLASLPKVSQISENCTCTFGSKLTESQIDYLKEFNKRVFLIVDNDLAGDLMIEHLIEEGVDNLYIIKVPSEDTDDSFVQDIKSTRPIPAKKYYNQQIKRLL